MARTMARMLAIYVALLLGVLGYVAGPASDPSGPVTVEPVTIDLPRIPSCQEDAVLIGVGDFDGVTGTWDAYECGPSVDDYWKGW